MVSVPLFLEKRFIEHEIEHYKILVNTYTDFSVTGVGRSNTQEDALKKATKDAIKMAQDKVKELDKLNQERQDKWDQEDRPKVMEFIIDVLKEALKSPPTQPSTQGN